MGTTQTIDVIHATLENLGYTADRFGVAGVGLVSFGIYRGPGADVTVTWPPDASTCELLTGSAAVALLLCELLALAGLICERSGRRIDVHGQNHIDAEVRKMLG